MFSISETSWEWRFTGLLLDQTGELGAVTSAQVKHVAQNNVQLVWHMAVGLFWRFAVLR